MTKNSFAISCNCNGMSLLCYCKKATGRLALKGKREAQAAFEAERLKLSQEKDERLRDLEKTHGEEIKSMRDKADKAIRETEEAAAARRAADRDAAMDEVQRVERVAAEVKAVADQKILGLEEELEGLRKRLDEVPGQLRANLEREFDERERHAREEARDEVMFFFLISITNIIINIAFDSGLMKISREGRGTDTFVTIVQVLGGIRLARSSSNT